MNAQAVKTMGQFLTAEHTSLQNALNATVVESNGRSASFLTTISASIVALAFIAQISEFSHIFMIFSLALLPILSFIGFSAYVRILQLDFSTYVYTVAINRIRHFYVDVTPELAKYLSLPAADDERGVQRTRVLNTNTLWNVVSLNSSLILVIDGLLIGTYCGLLTAIVFQVDTWLPFGVGVIVFLVVSVLLYRLGMKWYANLRDRFEIHYPSLDE